MLSLPQNNDLQNTSGLQVYDEFVARHEAAYTGFVKYYTLKNPPPQPAEIHRDYVSTIIVIALAIVMVASIIVSSSRTIDEFGGGQIGTIAFIMVEGGIMAYAFFRARRTASTERLEKTVKWATVGLALTFIVGLGANMDAELRHKGINLPDWVNVGINLLVGISAPTLAFISSDVLAIELMATDIKKRQADKDHKIAMKEWEAGRSHSWASQQKQWGVGKIEVERPAPRELPSNLIKSDEKSQRNKPSIRLQKALDYLNGHPEDLEKPSRDLEVKIDGISYGTIHKAQQMIRAEKQGGE